ncbi:MAG: phosphoglucosamine mutase [Acidobacteriota bacterium]|jgi:phosphoglucosamine mutase|nr:phosphoglucosamine mutase [Acidobacteriaceae bacterium]
MGKQLFGTDGMRGVASEYPLDAPTVFAFGRALGEWAREHSAEPRVAIGMDTRESGEQLSRWLMAGLKAAGVTPDHHGVVTTPCVAWLTKHGPFVAGVMISASHNPYQDNGLKVFAHSGYKLPDAVEQELEDRIFALAGPAPEPVSWRWFGMRDRAYREHLANVFPLPLTGRKLVMDCANGAAFSSAPLLLRELGAEVMVLSGEPDGRNINAGCGALHPENLRRAVVEHGAWCGVAFDGDADRAMFVSATGKVIDGDHVLFILGRDLKRRGRLPKAEVVATVMSNLGLEVALRRYGIALVRTAVGDKYVLEEMIRREAVIGGEQSGHMIFHEYATTGDGVLTLLLLLDVMLREDAGLDALTEEFTVFPQRLINVRFAVKRPLEEQAGVQQAIRACEGEFGDAGRVLVRFSGTEPLARVMVEGPSADRVEHHAQAIAAQIAAALV